jgi:asparagine synthase (glutamine-hydrolysing)
MCGICGIINLNGKPVEQNVLKKMMGAMKHRGPDDEGIFIDGHIGFGHVRLSILDLSSAGHQPMISDNGRHVLIFNGLIYNYLELRKELEDFYRFKSSTDTEVVLNALRQYGETALDRFNGMFSFAVYDRETKTVFMARDRFGIKPFYYYQNSDIFIFASDIPPILSIVNETRQPENQSIYDYLLLSRTNHTDLTFFKDIKKLQHSHCLKVDSKGIKLRRWYDLGNKIGNPFQSPEEFKDLLKSSVELRLRSDVPIGACLSGGLDSSSIVSMVIKDFGFEDIHTFSAVYDEGVQGDESPYINEFSSTLKNMHFVRPTASEFCSDLNVFVEEMVEPVPNTSEYAEFKVMELAKEHCTVVLNGQGADEEMAGYHAFFGFHFKELLLKARLFSLGKEIAAYLKQHHSFLGLSSFFYLMLPGFLKNNQLILKKGYVTRDFVSRHSYSPEIIRELYGSRSMNQALLNHFEYKFEHHLIWADKTGMWFSLETRFPFLDHRFVERVLSLDSKEILWNGTTKRILRKAMHGTLPDKIVNRKDNVGYETPENDWFREKVWEERILDLLHSKRFCDRGYFNSKKCLVLYKKHLNKKTNIAGDIWKWLNLELWFEKYIDS